MLSRAAVGSNVHSLSLGRHVQALPYALWRCAHVAPFSTTSPRSATEEEYTTARQWLDSFSPGTIPRDVGDVSYSRSSGPGGQNVNKVNSKAQLRVPLERLFTIVPSALHVGIRRSRYYAEKTRSLLIQADDSRRQAANKDTCYRRLDDLILEVARESVPGETSQGQKDKVKALQRTENESRLKSKKQHSSKKASRSKGACD